MFESKFDAKHKNTIEASQQDDAARFEEICELLVAAGYFRARIAALSPFDKVVGGMAWCMTATSVDVDVAFIENATIGQKIKIGEGIERALRQMKCRIPLQAHQIQGLDYAAIFPVVQWLVKQAYAYKDEIADATRRLSASHFHRHHFSLPSDTELAARRSTALPAAEQLNSSYVPTRRFKPKAEIASQQQPPGIHARRVLMEYGAQLAALVAQQATAEEEGEKEKQRKSKTKAESSAPSATPTGASDLSAADMSLLEDGEGDSINKAGVGKLVRMGAKEIMEAAAEFQRKSELLAQSGEMAGVHRLRGERDQLSKQLDQAQRQLNKAIAAAKAAEEAKGAAESAKVAASGQLDVQAQRKLASEAEMAKLEELAATCDKDVLARLQALVALNERMVSQKSEFKKACAKQLGEMNAELEALKAMNSDTVRAAAGTFSPHSLSPSPHPTLTPLTVMSPLFCRPRWMRKARS